MAAVEVNASLNTKLKFFSDYENVNPHASITLKREVPNDWTDEQMLELSEQLYKKARGVVQKVIEADIKSAKGDKFKGFGQYG